MAQDVRYRILALDDNEEVLELIRLTLSDNYDVVTLRDPVNLYEVMDVFEPDLLILDVMMPKVSGFQLTEMLRRKNDTKDLPIIIMSAKSSPGDVKHGYKVGATLYLTKPFAPDRLLKNVETQFQVQPPQRAAKSQNVNQVAETLHNTSSFRKGLIGFSDKIQKKEHNVDPRRKMEEKILSDEERLRKTGK